MRDTIILGAGNWVGSGPYYQSVVFQRSVADGTVSMNISATAEHKAIFNDSQIAVDSITGNVVKISATKKPIMSIPVDFTYSEIPESVQNVSIDATLTDSTHFTGSITKSDFRKLRDGNIALIVSIGGNNAGLIKFPSVYYDKATNILSAYAVQVRPGAAESTNWGLTISGTDYTVAGKTISGGGGGGTTIGWTQIVHSGTKIAEITVDGTTTEVFAPSVDVPTGTVTVMNTQDKPQLFRGTVSMTAQLWGSLTMGNGEFKVALQTHDAKSQLIVVRDYAKIDSTMIIARFTGSDFADVPDGATYGALFSYDSTNLVMSAMVATVQTGASWGDISGLLSDQADLQEALDGKANAKDLNALSDTVIGHEKAISNLSAAIGEKSKVVAKASAVGGATEIHALEVDGTDYNLPTGGGGSEIPYISFDVILDIPTGTISGKLTQVQYDALRGGTKFASVNILVDGVSYAKATGTIFAEQTGHNAIVGVIAYNLSGRQMSVANVMITDDLSISGQLDYVGHSIEMSSEMFESGLIATGFILDGTEYNFSIAVDSEMSESSERPVKNMVIKSYVDGKIDDSVIVVDKTWSSTKIENERQILDTAISNKFDISNIVSEWSETTLNTHVASEKLVKDSLDLKQSVANLVTSLSASSDITHYPSAKTVYDFVLEYAADFKGSVATKADLATITGMNINDWAIVLADESQSGKTTRYGYNGSAWYLQWAVNNTTFTSAQWDSINSGITGAKVTIYDGYATTIAGKQDVTTLEKDVAALGFTKNVGDVSIITMNGETKTPVAGIVDLGTVLTAHQDITGKQDKATLDADVAALGYIKGGSSGITGIKMNGASVTVTAGIADLGVVLTEHQSLAGYATTADLQSGLATRQPLLDDAGNLAVASGITATKVATYDGYATSKQSKITYGTTDPTGGVDGDVYIKYST